MAKIKAVIFDLDGTLLDRKRSLRAFVENQYDRYKPALQNITKEHYVERFIELDNNGYTWKDEVYQNLVKEFALDSVKWEELLEDYMVHFRNHVIAYSHTNELLDWLKTRGLKIGMITNGLGQFQLNNVEALGIAAYFDEILVSEIEGVNKPDGEIFYRTLKRLNVNAAEAVFIGDHPLNDVQASKNVGMISVWKRNDQAHNDKVEADVTIDDLLEIKNVLN